MSSILQLLTCRSVAVLLLILINASGLHAQIVSTGPMSSSTVTSVSFPGSTFSFNNTAASQASDNNRASASANASNLKGKTAYLQATGFGFSIPPTGVVTGIEVEVEKRATGNAFFLGIPLSYVTDNSVKLVRNGSVAGHDRASSSLWDDQETNSTYGDDDDIWGISWLPGDINSPDFGIAISAELTGFPFLTPPSAQIDRITITVYYLEDAALPQLLLNFKARAAGNNTVAIQWKTSGDETASYLLERSPNGADWETVPGIPQRSSTGLTHSYQLTDYQPYSELSYYRLTMLEPSGNKTFSPIQVVKMKKETTVSVYPNPFTSHVVISGVNAGDPISILDVYGQRIRPRYERINTGTLRLDLHALKPGIYFIHSGKTVTRIIRN